MGNHSSSHNIVTYKVSKIANSIIWGSGTNVIYESGSVKNTCVEGGHAGQGNIDADPMFAGAYAGDYRLSLQSPCLDAGNAGALTQDVADLDEDLETDEPTPLDLQMTKRILDGAIDMGAFERCRHDLSGDGKIDIDDLLPLLSAWGAEADGPPDFDGNGTVGIMDLLELLSNWNGCV